MDNKLGKLVERFNALSNRRRELEPQVRRFASEELRDVLREQAEYISAIRQEIWGRQQIEKACLEAECAEAKEGVEATKALLDQKRLELQSARAAGDSSSAEIAGTIEELEQRRATLYARYQSLVKQLNRFKLVEQFTGTLGEFRTRLLDPGFVISREWAEALMRGVWRYVEDDQELHVKFSKATGEVTEFWPEKPNRLPWLIYR